MASVGKQLLRVPARQAHSLHPPRTEEQPQTVLRVVGVNLGDILVVCAAAFLRACAALHQFLLMSCTNSTRTSECGVPRAVEATQLRDIFLRRVTVECAVGGGGFFLLVGRIAFLACAHLY